jgi:1-deoxy-D-xylulose 5-phosphate reductoisomerase
MDISELVTGIVENHQKRKVQSLEDIFDVDRETRRVSLDLLKKRS